MNTQKALQRVLGLMLTLLLLAGCGGTSTGPAVAPTAIASTTAPAQPSATATAPTPIPGIGAPITIDGIPFQVTSIKKQDTYEVSFQQKFVPNSAADTCLIVEGTISTTETEKVRKWEVSVTDENGRTSKPNLASTQTDGMGMGKAASWLFVVSKSARSITLNLPGGQTISLDTLSSSSASALPGVKPTPSVAAEKVTLTAASATISAPYCVEAKAKGAITGNTFLCASSESGEFVGGGKNYLLTPADGDFAATVSGHYVNVSVGKAGAGQWRLEFAPPAGQPLKAGLFDSADMSSPNAASSYISISGNSRGCDAGKTKGKFEILELVYTPGGPVERLAANFEYHCDGKPAALLGAIRFNSTVAP